MTLKTWGLGALLVLVSGLGAAASAETADAGVLISGDSGLGPGLGGPQEPEMPLDYDAVEIGGEVQADRDIHADATVVGFRDGYRFASPGDVAVLSVEPGHVLEPGKDYVAFRDEGELGGGVPGGGDPGRLLRNVAVLQILSASKREAEARVVRLYGVLQQGDELRSRAGRRRAYARLLDMRPAESKPLKGVVVGVLPPALYAGAGDFVYLNVGWRQGAVPGLRLKVISHPDSEAGAFGTDDDSSSQPASPIRPLNSSDEVPSGLSSGAIASLEVVNASRDACVALVLGGVGVVSLGDRADPADPAGPAGPAGQADRP